MIELMLKLMPRFTKEDKENCLPIMERMVEMAGIASTNGLLIFEEKLREGGHPFLLAGMSMLADGSDTEDISQMLSAMITSGGYSGSELLGRLLIGQGIILMNEGAKPSFVRRTLISMLGEEYFVNELIGL